MSRVSRHAYFFKPYFQLIIGSLFSKSFAEKVVKVCVVHSVRTHYTTTKLLSLYSLGALPVVTLLVPYKKLECEPSEISQSGQS